MMYNTFFHWKQPVRDGPLNPQPHRQYQPHRLSMESSIKPSLGVDDVKGKWRHKLEYLKEMIWGVDLIMVVIASSMATFWVNQTKNEWQNLVSGSKPAITTLGALFSFALVFRTNICYSRWWEGRCLWGSIIVCSIRLAQQAHLWVKEPELVHRLSCLAITFAYCCKAQLRGAGIEDETEDGDTLVHKGVISQEELDMIATQNGWQPYYCIDAMRATISEGLVAEEAKDEWKMNAAQAAMEDTICALSSTIGGCIRVRSTGLPVAYDDILNTVGFIFFTAACLAWAPGAGLYNPAVVLIVYIIVKMIIGVGSDMEDPFGHDESDLHLEKFCAGIHKQIISIEERSRILTYDLARGPSSEKEASPHIIFTKTSSYSSTHSLSPTEKESDVESGAVPTETDRLIDQ